MWLAARDESKAGLEGAAMRTKSGRRCHLSNQNEIQASSNLLRFNELPKETTNRMTQLLFAKSHCVRLWSMIRPAISAFIDILPKVVVCLHALARRQKKVALYWALRCWPETEARLA